MSENNNGVITDIKIIDDKTYIVLENNCLYRGGGGQPPDKGYIVGKDFKAVLKNVENIDVRNYWLVESNKEITIGDVEIFIDELWRFELSQQHTAQHIVSGFALSLFGWVTDGFTIFDDYSKIEFLSADDDEEKYKILEQKTNEAIIKSIPVKIFETDGSLETRKKIDKDIIRVVEIGDIDRCPCGGTHVENTSQLGGFCIISFERKNSKCMKVEFSSGLRSGRILKEFYNREAILRKKLTGEISERIDELLKENSNFIKKERTLIELLSKNISDKDGIVELRDLPISNNDLKYLSSLLSKRGLNSTLVNNEGYFSISGDNSEALFEKIKLEGAVGGGKGIITGKLNIFKE